VALLGLQVPLVLLLYPQYPGLLLLACGLLQAGAVAALLKGRRPHQDQSDQAPNHFFDALGAIGDRLITSLSLETLADSALSQMDQVVDYTTVTIALLGHITLIRRKQHGCPEIETLTSLPDSFAAWMEPLEDAPIQMRQTADSLIIVIQIDHQVRGYLLLTAPLNGSFSADAIERLRLVAKLIGVALRSVATYESLQVTVDELDRLYRATSVLFDAANLTTLGQQIAEAIVREFGQMDCGVMLLDRDTGNIRRLARSGSYQVAASFPLHRDGPGLVAEAVRTGEIVYVADVRQDDRYIVGMPNTRSELVIPLKSRIQGVLGALDLQSEKIAAFGERDQRLLAAFAERVAVAIGNMLLYETLQNFALDREYQVIKRTEELQRAKERAETILNSTSDTLILTLPDGRIEQSNGAFYNLFGYDYDEEFDWPLERLLAPDSRDSLCQHLNEALSNRRASRLEVVACRKDGSQFDADVVLSPIFRQNEQACEGIVCSLRDISQRKQMENELREALAKERELRELKSRFISMTSHEFRTPLATILATSTLLSNYSDRMDEAKRRRQFEKIEAQIDYMIHLLDGVLTIGRIEAGRMPVDISLIAPAAFFEELAEEFRQMHPTHPLDFVCVGHPDQLPADDKLLREIVNNLLSNAVKYSPPGSTVHLHLTYRADALEIRVQDHGIGIPERDQPHLFEPFHRAENVGTAPGTGLGLAIVKHAVELQGGTVRFISRVGEGTTFIVTLPLPQEIEVTP
jgi:PAS domain S-box-containing protein